MKNYAYFMTGLSQMERREIPMPQPKAGQVVVRIQYVGICGSDSHYLAYGKVGGFVVEKDMILGHEASGEVVAVGEGVATLNIGDRVALEPGITCGQCYHCKTGNYNLCPNVEFLATPPYDGALCNYLAFPANMCFRLPDDVSTKEGALIEPLAVGLHAANQGSVGVGETVVILGAGCIGLVTLLACKAHGAGKIIVSDVIENRLNFAKELGADYTVNSAETDIHDFVSSVTNGHGADVVLETAGSPVTIGQTAYLVRSGGRIVLVGLAIDEILPFNFAQIMAKEASIHSVFRYRNLYPGAILAVASGKIDVAKIVTHEFDFSNTPEAFDYVQKNKADVVKAVIRL